MRTYIYLKVADDALYLAKREGKNRMVAASSLENSPEPTGFAQ